MTAWITNLQNFISLSKKQRESLVHEILIALKQFFGPPMYDPINPRIKGTHIELRNHDIKLQVIISSLFKDDKGNNIREILILPYDMIGQAGYLNGEYIFSENYYLNLKVKGDLAVSSGQDKVIIKKEVNK